MKKETPVVSNRVLAYLRQNVLALLALMVALGGTSYAAFSLPSNSVGGRQIRNHAIDAVKLDKSSIAASIKAWVNVQWGPNGLRAAGSSSRVRVTGVNQGASIQWVHRRFATSCMISATPQYNVNPQFGFSGTVTAQFLPRQGLLNLSGFGPDGSARPQAAAVLVVCPTT
jgi:hypothetical protein